jgi:hemerythrin-like metal-binding protein
MATINWNDALSVKIESIDVQHRKLIDLINHFYDNVNKQAPKELMFEMIQALKEYTVFHFSTEERYMKLHGFPEYLNHKAEHDAFVTKVLDIEARFKSGKILMTTEITGFIRNWVAKHIMETDKKYSDFLIAKGVK